MDFMDENDMGQEELEKMQLSHALIQSKLDDDYANYRKILSADFVMKSGKTEAPLKLTWMIDNHNFFRDYAVRENKLEKKTSDQEAEDWLEQREHQRKVVIPPAGSTDVSMSISENQETRRCGGSSTLTESKSSPQKMNTDGKPPPRCANCYETLPWTHRSSYPRINKTPINEANTALIKLHKVRTLCETCMAQPVRDAIWLIRNMEGTWKCNELIQDNTGSCEELMEDIIRRSKEVIHVESTSSNGMAIPELTVKIARKEGETRSMLDENDECFKLIMKYTHENLTAEVTKPEKRCTPTKEIMELKMEKYKTGKVEWKDSNGIATARIMWRNNDNQNIALWTQTWKAPMRTPSINEENIRFVETIRIIVRNPHPEELPITDEEKSKMEESRKLKGTMIDALKTSMKETHETLIKIAGETVSNFFAITNPFEPESEMWDRQVSVRVMKRKTPGQQTECGLFPKEDQERRCGGNSTIIEPDKNLEEVLRVWAKITDSVDNTAQRIGRRLMKVSNDKKAGVYKIIVPGDRERSLDKIKFGETTLERYDWSKQLPYKNLTLTLELLWIDEKANSWIQEEEQFNDIHVPAIGLHIINKEWSERMIPQVGDWFKSNGSNMEFTTNPSSNPRRQKLTSKVSQSNQILCKVNHETSRQIRKLIPTRYHNELHYKVETRIPEWKGPVYTTIARKKRNGSFENWTELYMRTGNTRDEAKRYNVILDYPFDELQELEIQKRRKKMNIMITGIPTKVEPEINLEELIKRHIIQEKEKRSVAVEIQYDENQNAVVAMATFNSEEHADEAIKTMNCTKMKDYPNNDELKMRRPTDEETREFAYETGARSREYQSPPFATQRDFECIVMRSEFLKADQKKICVEWLKAGVSLPIAWAQARSNYDWKKTIQNNTDETWEAQIIRMQGTSQNFTKLQEQIVAYMHKNDRDLLENWERYKIHECDKWRITKKEVQEDQISSDETEETDDEETITRIQKKDCKEMQDVMNDGNQERYLKARTAVVIGLPPRKTADQRDDLIEFLQQNGKIVTAASVSKNGQAFVLCTKSRHIRTLARFCTTKPFQGRHLRVYRFTNEIQRQMCPYRQLIYNHYSTCENMRNALKSGKLGERSVYMREQPVELEAAVKRAKEVQQSIRITEHIKDKEDKTSEKAMSITYESPEKADVMMHEIHTTGTWRRAAKRWNVHLTQQEFDLGLNEEIEYTNNIRKLREYWEMWIPKWNVCKACDRTMSADEVCRWENSQLDESKEIEPQCDECKHTEYEENGSRIAMIHEENLTSKVNMYYSKTKVNMENLLKAVQERDNKTRQINSIEAIKETLQESMNKNGTPTIEGLHEGLKMIYNVSIDRKPYEEPDVATRALIGRAIHEISELSVGTDQKKCPFGKCKESHFEGSRFVQLCSKCHNNHKTPAQAAVEETLQVSESTRTEGKKERHTNSEANKADESKNGVVSMETDQTSKEEEYPTEYHKWSTDEKLEWHLTKQETIKDLKHQSRQRITENTRHEEDPDKWYNSNGMRWVCEKDRTPGRCNICQNKYTSGWTIDEDMTDDDYLEYYDYADKYPHRQEIDPTKIKRNCCSERCIQHHISGKWSEKRRNLAQVKITKLFDK